MATGAVARPGRRRHGRRIGALAVGLALLAGALAPPSAAASADFPELTGLELKALYYASLPLPGTQRITARPPIYGHAAADLRIQQLAEQRGYRLQVTPTTPLGSYGGLTLAADAGRAWTSLLDASRRNGTPLQGNSGYRSVDMQREIFRRRLGGFSTAQIASGAADAAIERVLAYHSIPGYSRHHTAKTIDMSAAGGSNGSFAATAAYRWLSADNYRVAKSFGFIPNYPPGAGAQGPNPEPWEFVYLGTGRIRCAVEVIPVADPDAALICGYPDRPIVGELTGDGIDDVFVYRAGPRADARFRGTSTRTPTSGTAIPVTGFYHPIVGDFRGDGISDILWYAPGPAPDSLWTFQSNGGYAKRGTNVAGTYVPIAGDFNGDGTDDIFWYGPGPAIDAIWYHRPDGSHVVGAAHVAGLYIPVAGDFDGNGVDDILWYTPGSAPDTLWSFRTDGSHTNRSKTINGTFDPVAGDFDGNGIDDIVWYAAGPAADAIWYQRSDTSHLGRLLDIKGTYEIGAGDHDGDGLDDLVIVAPPGGTDWVWFGAPGGFVKAARSY